MSKRHFLLREMKISNRAIMIAPIAAATISTIGVACYVFSGRTTSQTRNEFYDGVVRYFDEKTGRSRVSYDKGLESWGCAGNYGNLSEGQKVVVELSLEEEVRRNWRGLPVSNPVLLSYSVVSVSPKKDVSGLEQTGD